VTFLSPFQSYGGLRKLKRSILLRLIVPDKKRDWLKLKKAFDLRAHISKSFGGWGEETTKNGFDPS